MTEAPKAAPAGRDALLDRFRRGDRLALSRLVSLVARNVEAGAILDGLPPPARAARVVALTGSGGVGKSTLVGKLIGKAREQNHKVAVLACDPESPLSGGALLGDRFRMPAHPHDDGVFIRSLASAGGQGALAQNLGPLIRVLEAFGFDLVLIETAGAGQNDTAVRALADVLVLLLQPETGDDLQWEKAGLPEVADVVVIHKADLPGAERVESEVLTALGLTGGPAPPVLRVSSRTGAGLDPLWQTISELPPRRAQRRDALGLLHAAQQLLAERYRRALAAGSAGVRGILARWQEGHSDGQAAGRDLLRALGTGDKD